VILTAVDSPSPKSSWSTTVRTGTDDGAVHLDRDATPAVEMPGLLGARRDRPARPALRVASHLGETKSPGTRQEQAIGRRGRRLDGWITGPARPSRRVQRLDPTCRRKA